MQQSTSPHSGSRAASRTRGRELSAIEREIIEDIRAVCRRCGWPANRRPKFEAYLDRRGHFYEKQIKALGGWKKLCARGGMQGTTPLARVRHETIAPQFDIVVADVRRVAQSLRLKRGARLTRAVYLRSGGLYGEKTIRLLGGWASLSAAAGVPSRMGQRGEPRHAWQKTKPIVAGIDFDAALDRALGRKPVPRGILCMMGVKRARFKVSPALRREIYQAHQAPPVLARGEVIADIRQVSLSLGLLSPRLLTFDTYRNHGGRYTHEQTATLGGFDNLRRAA